MLFFTGSEKMLSLEKINEYLCNELKGIDINIFDKDFLLVDTYVKGKKI